MGHSAQTRLMRMVLAALLAIPVAAAVQIPRADAQRALSLPPPSDKQVAREKERKRQAQEADKSYQDTLKQVPEQKAPDPWAKMR